MEEKYIATIINSPILQYKNKPVVKFKDNYGNIITGEIINMNCQYWAKGQNIYVRYENNQIYAYERDSSIIKKENKKEKILIAIILSLIFIAIIFTIYRSFVTEKYYYFFYLLPFVFLCNVFLVILIIKLGTKDINKIKKYTGTVEGTIVSIKPIVVLKTSDEHNSCPVRDWRIMFKYEVNGIYLYNIEEYINPMLYDYKVGDHVYISYDKENPLYSCLKDFYDWANGDKKILGHVAARRCLTTGTIVNICCRKIDINDKSNEGIYEEELIECEYIVNNCKYRSLSKYASDKGIYHIGDKISISYEVDNPEIFYLI